ncbi:MAG: transcription termination factor NusA [Symbiobacteriaceae bacterium]|nr:transcription termination factor NusA [Symbiobacteriaceae bacterium]
MNTELIEALHQVVREKHIPEDVLFQAIEQAMVSAYKRNFGSAQNVRVVLDRETGSITVLSQRKIVEEVSDLKTEISLEEARVANPESQVGEFYDTEVTPRDFGRIAAQTAKQVVVQRIREAERGYVYEQYVERESDIVTGMVLRSEQRNVLLELENQIEGLLPGSEQAYGEVYSPGNRIKAYVIEVKRAPRGPQIVVSRTHPGLLRRLFELAVPELFDGTVELKAIAREAGQRSKIAVYSANPDVDPVGACVGPKGTRVQTVVNELGGEKIDIVRWSTDMAEFVANALSPAKALAVTIGDDGKSARVIVQSYQLSLAIGKEGQNARLAAKLTGCKIDIKSVDVGIPQEQLAVDPQEQV